MQPFQPFQQFSCQQQRQWSWSLQEQSAHHHVSYSGLSDAVHLRDTLDLQWVWIPPQDTLQCEQEAYCPRPYRFITLKCTTLIEASLFCSQSTSYLVSCVNTVKFYGQISNTDEVDYSFVCQSNVKGGSLLTTRVQKK